jgi:hypothetical protein
MVEAASPRPLEKQNIKQSLRHEISSKETLFEVPSLSRIVDPDCRDRLRRRGDFECCASASTIGRANRRSDRRPAGSQRLPVVGHSFENSERTSSAPHIHFSGDKLGDGLG